MVPDVEHIIFTFKSLNFCSKIKIEYFNIFIILKYGVIYKLPKDILVKLIVLLKHDYEERIDDLEMKIQLCRDVGIRFHYCNAKGCEFVEASQTSEILSLYKCYSCKNNFCDDHIVYCQICEDFMCLEDISLCREYHREI